MRSYADFGVGPGGAPTREDFVVTRTALPSSKGHELPSARAPVVEPESPMAIAREIARILRDVPGVAGLSPGRFDVAATYGPGGVVPGVVVRRDGAGELVVAAYIVAALALVTDGPSDAGASPEPDDMPPLLALAERERERVRMYCSARALPLVGDRVRVVIADLAEAPGARKDERT